MYNCLIFAVMFKNIYLVRISSVTYIENQPFPAWRRILNEAANGLFFPPRFTAL